MNTSPNRPGMSGSVEIGHQVRKYTKWQRRETTHILSIVVKVPIVISTLMGSR